MKILVTGDREWDNFEAILDALISVLDDYKLVPSEIIVIHGDCRGADKMAAYVSEEMGITPIPYPAKWSQYGKAAGAIRNKEMLKDNPEIELALVFHSNLNESKGTRDMVGLLKKAGIEYRHYKL